MCVQPGEWFLDSKSGLLSLIPPAGVDLQQLQAATVEAPKLKTLVQFRGSAVAPVTDVQMSGFNLTGAAQTFLDDYEAPSGGDCKFSISVRAQPPAPITLTARRAAIASSAAPGSSVLDLRDRTRAPVSR